MVSIKPKFFFLFLISGIMAALTACGTDSKVVITPMSNESAAVQTDMEKYNNASANERGLYRFLIRPQWTDF